MLDEEEIDEAPDVALGDASAGSARDHEIDLAGRADGREHDLAGPLMQDPQEELSLFGIEVNHARGPVGCRSLPIAQPRVAAGRRHVVIKAYASVARYDRSCPSLGRRLTRGLGLGPRTEFTIRFPSATRG